MVKILNMSHPLSSEAKEQIASLSGTTLSNVVEIILPVQLDMDGDISKQLADLYQEVKAEIPFGFYVPPALSFASAYVAKSLANGAFAPGMIVLKGVGVPRRFVVAEIV